MEGKIIRGIGGFYYVHVPGSGVWECRARGLFRNQKMKPLVGDDAEIEVIDAEKKTGSVVQILPRRNSLIRPAVANVDQAMILFALKSPEPSFNLLDRFLILMEQQDVPTIICFNKCDLCDESYIEECRNIYDGSGSRVITCSIREENLRKYSEEGILSPDYTESDPIREIRDLLAGRTTVLAGPSGVGKSSLMKMLDPSAAAETGEISQKVQRGKHTTRHSELFSLGNGGTYVMDTPGFTSLNVFVREERDIRFYYPEFESYSGQCRFPDCVHAGEKICAVRDAAADGRISPVRYANYLQIYEEVKNTAKY